MIFFLININLSHKFYGNFRRVWILGGEKIGIKQILKRLLNILD